MDDTHLCDQGNRSVSVANTEDTDDLAVEDEVLIDDMDEEDVEAAHNIVHVSDIQSRRNRIIAAVIVLLCVSVSICVGVSLTTGKAGITGEKLNAEDDNSPATPPSSVHVPMAPSNLVEICAPPVKTLNEDGAADAGVATCRDLCKPAYCCESTCYHQKNCLGYEPCWGRGGSITRDQGDFIIDIDHDTPPPAVDILVKETCTRDNIQTVDGRFACEELCRERSCCYGPSGRGVGNCYEESPEWCGEYAPCALLNGDTVSKQGDGDVDEQPPGEINDLDTELDSENLTGTSEADELALACSPDGIARSRYNCVKICEARLCCFVSQDDDTWCYNERKHWCEQYSPCQILNVGHFYVDSVALIETGNNTALPQDEELSGGDNEEQTLSHISISSNSSAEVPMEFEQEAAIDIEVTEGHRNISSNSQGLSSIFGVSNGTPKEENPAELAVPEVDVKCTAQKIRTTAGFDDCKRICDRRSCCFVEGVENCYSRNPVLCNEYISCQALYHYTKEDGQQQEAIQQVEVIEPLESGALTDSPSSSDGVETVHQQIKTVQEACSTENLRTKMGKGECEAICAPGECCFAREAEFNCEREHQSWCQDYGRCVVLNHQEIEGQVAGVSTKSAIRQSCSPEKLSNIDGWMECTTLCEERECCRAGTCGKARNYCSDYYICRTIENNSLPSSISSSGQSTGENEQGADMAALVPSKDASVATPNDVRHVCTREKIKLDRLTCERKCESKICCFSEGNDNCMADTGQECFNFSPCKILYGTDEDGIMLSSDDTATVSALVPPSPPNLSALCSFNAIKTEIGCGACKDACTPAKCCSNPNNGLCDQTMCIAYAACQTIWLLGDDACMDEKEWIAEPNP